MTTVDSCLTRLLPPIAAGMTGIMSQSVPFRQAKPSSMLEHSDTSKALEASAMAARDGWLCHRFSISLLELHLLLLQRIAKNFSTMALQMSRSPLASLLRQQHVSNSEVDDGSCGIDGIVSSVGYRRTYMSC